MDDLALILDGLFISREENIKEKNYKETLRIA